MSEDTPQTPDTEESEGGQSVGDTTQDTKPEGLTLEQINDLTGKQYKSLEDAQKGIQHLSSFVGKRQEKVAEEVIETGNFITKDQYEQDMFYSKREDLVPYKDIINARARELNLSVSEAVEKDEALKTSLDKLRGYDDTEKARSVLMSNPRLGQVTDKLSVAREASAKGDFVAAEKNAVAAVMDIASGN